MLRATDALTTQIQLLNERRAELGEEEYAKAVAAAHEVFRTSLHRTSTNIEAEQISFQMWARVQMKVEGVQMKVEEMSTIIARQDFRSELNDFRNELTRELRDALRSAPQSLVASQSP